MKPDIIIHKVNDTYCWVECENSIAYSLDEYFTFFVPGYKFMPKFKSKQWDGTIHLLNLRNRELYLGLAEYIKDFAKNNEYTVSMDADVVGVSPITPKDVFEYISSLNLHSSNKKIECRDYQLFAIHHALKNKRALLLSPTSSGKSLMIYGICRSLQPAIQKKILVLVPTTGLVSQMTGDFADYSSANGWIADDNVHQIMGGREKNSDKQIYVSTWQSIFRQPKSYFDQFGAVIVDECHLATSNSIRSIAENLTDCPYKLGFTGTLSGAKTSQLVLEGLMGKVQKVITTKTLMDNKAVAQLEIKALMLTYTAEEKKLLNKAKYQDEVAWLYTNEKRLNFTAKLAVSQKKNSLFLFNHISHGEAIYERAMKLVDKKRNVYFITGKMPAEERNRIRAEVELDSNAIIFASYGVFSTGVSIKNLHVVGFYSPTKSKIKTLQSLGRGLRVNSEKTDVVLYDIVDDLSNKKHKNYALKHFMERADYYNTEKFDFSIIRINL